MTDGFTTRQQSTVSGVLRLLRLLQAYERRGADLFDYMAENLKPSAANSQEFKERLERFHEARAALESERILTINRH